MVYDLVISVVLFRNKNREVHNLLSSVEGLKLNYALVFVDNAPGETPFDFESLKAPLYYLASPENLGYGRGHNLVIQSEQWKGKYHLIANPDLEFKASALSAIFQKMEANREVSLLMPRIVYPNGEDQGLRKLLPAPGDLFLRRFIPQALQSWFSKAQDRYELNHLNPNLAMQVPVLSGCFMFCRAENLYACGGFDARFFLYMEDVDLSRRLNQRGQNLYWPEVEVVHHYQKSSYRNWRSLKLHLQSAWRYFNKYGWFFDSERSRINRLAVEQKQN